MRRKARELFSLLVIIFLLPYVVTLFMNGAHIKTSSRVKKVCVKVAGRDEGRGDGVGEICRRSSCKKRWQPIRNWKR